MKKLYALNDWGIHIGQGEVASGLVTTDEIVEAGGMQINPVAGEVYYDGSGEYVIPQMPFWFIPIQQPGLFEAPYEGIEDIEAELTDLLPDALLAKCPIRDRLCRANVVDEQEDGHG